MTRSSGRPNRLRALVLLAACVLASPASAFGTVTIFGQHAEHAQISRMGLARAGFEPRTLKVLVGGDGAFGAVGAPDRPGRGLTADKAAHCDGADRLDITGYPHPAAEAARRLVACRARMAEQMNLALAAAGDLVDMRGRPAPGQAPSAETCRFDGRADAPARCRALDAFGAVLHAAQDFYSHSNWVDRPLADRPIGLDNPPGLGRTGRAAWIELPVRAGPPPEGLMTGCYDGFPEWLHCRGRVAHKALAKDTGLIGGPNGAASVGDSPRGLTAGNFARAVAAAVDDTASRWAWLEARVRQTHDAAAAELILCLLRSDDPGACRRR